MVLGYRGLAVEDERTLDELAPRGERPSGHDDLHVVLECDRPLSGSTRHCVDDVDEVVFRRGREREATREVVAGVRRLTLDLPDSHISSQHATLRRIEGRWQLRDAGSRNGSYVDGRRVDSALLSDGAAFELGHTHLLLRSRDLPRSLIDGPRDLMSVSAPTPALATLSHEREALFHRMVEAAQAGLAVLLVGEAGCGKDTMARAVHAASGGEGPFVCVPCVRLGRVRDSDHAGEYVFAELTAEFDRAAGGTLFLDEIDELGPVAPRALLAMLKSPSRARVARLLSSIRSSEPRPQVPRIPADLLAELAGFMLAIPPLRDRREDLGTLVAEIFARAGAGDRASIALAPAMGQALMQHDWPYNISELDGCLRSALAMSATDLLQWSPSTLLATSGPAARAAEGDAPSATRRSDPPPAHASTPPPSEPDAEFAQNVRRALKCNLSVAGLQKNGLLASDMVLAATAGSSAPAAKVPALRAILLSALDSLSKSSARGAKQTHVLRLTFIEPAESQQAAADQLAMAFGTYRRHVTSALAELTGILWLAELSARSRREHDPSGQGSASGEHTLLRSG